MPRAHSIVVTGRPFSQMLGADLALLPISQGPADMRHASLLGPDSFGPRQAVAGFRVPPFLSSGPPAVKVAGFRPEGADGVGGAACPAGTSR